jgi:hypothetical protein
MTWAISASVGRPPSIRCAGAGAWGHAGPALRAGVARPDGDDHAILRRDDVEPMRAVLADLHHLPAAAGAAPILGLYDPLDARQLGRQRAMRLRPLGAVRLRRLVGGGRRALRVAGLRLGDGGLDLLERQRELVGVQLLRAWPEPGALHLP